MAYSVVVAEEDSSIRGVATGVVMDNSEAETKSKDSVELEKQALTGNSLGMVVAEAEVAMEEELVVVEEVDSMAKAMRKKSGLNSMSEEADRSNQ
jgi:hypothetical protein